MMRFLPRCVDIRYTEVYGKVFPHVHGCLYGICMKNALFTGFIGENPAVLLSREQTPGIGMSLFSKDGGEKYHCAPTPSFAATGLLL